MMNNASISAGESTSMGFRPLLSSGSFDYIFIGRNPRTKADASLLHPIDMSSSSYG
jgi:hypothetical protein